MVFDNTTIQRITSEWGMKAGECFATATLMRPYEGDNTKEFAKSLEGKSA